MVIASLKIEDTNWKSFEHQIQFLECMPSLGEHIPSELNPAHSKKTVHLSLSLGVCGWILLLRLALWPQVLWYIQASTAFALACLTL